MARGLVFSLLLCGCFSDTPRPPSESLPPLLGGTLMVPGCSYTVTTPEGASAPLLGTDLLGPDPTPFAVHLGLAADPARSMNVVWRTRDEATLSTQVEYGIGDVLDHRTKGVTFSYENTLGAPVRIHEVHLCNLQPATVYSYRVGGYGAGGKEVFSQTYRFATAPDRRLSPRAQVLLAVLGDSRGGYARFGEMLRLARRLGPPDLILFTGDAVTYGPVQDEWDQFFAAAPDLWATVPLVMTHGNHEANAAAYFAQMAFPGDEQHFGLDYGPVHLSVLNDSPPDTAELSSKLVPFLEADLVAAAAAPFRLALHHRGLWSAALFHGGDATLRALIGPLYDRHRVDLVLSGHDHNYERTKPLRGEAVQGSPRDGTVYVIAGSAGAPLYDNGSDFFTAKSEKTDNMVLLRVRDQRLELSAYRPDGTLLDSLALQK